MCRAWHVESTIVKVEAVVFSQMRPPIKESSYFAWPLHSSLLCPYNSFVYFYYAPKITKLFLRFVPNISTSGNIGSSLAVLA